MQKSVIGIFAVAALLFLGTTTANASVTQIALGNSTSGTITFTSLSPSATFQLALNNVVGTASTIPSTTSFTYTLAGGGPTFIALTSDGVNYYTASNTPVSVFITDGTGDTLTGTMILVDLYQASTSGLVNFIPAITANLTVTAATGTLAGFESAGSGATTVTLTLASATAINDLGGTEYASVANGNITPSPEPRTMLLFGSGLVLLGGIVRRQLRA